jgi:hypothetical protein
MTIFNVQARLLGRTAHPFPTWPCGFLA